VPTGFRVCNSHPWIRFGNQGSAQAQNLHESGIANKKIVVANREDSYAARAKAKGFNVEHDFGEAADGE
jgi:ketol-acid reductoisomerase